MNGLKVLVVSWLSECYCFACAISMHVHDTILSWFPENNPPSELSIGLISGLMAGPILGAIVGACYAKLIYRPKKAKSSSWRVSFREARGEVDDKTNVIPAKIVPEELETKSVWMNFWLKKMGHYNPETYNVLKTSTVKVSLHGPWIEIRFPKRNLPKRRMYHDEEPSAVHYHGEFEVIDLSTCSIELLPKNLKTGKIWNKKYPIAIHTNTRKPLSEDAKTMVAHHRRTFCAQPPKNSDTPFHSWHLLAGGTDENDTTQSDENPDPIQDTCYLFARTSREKEEWFNRFVVAANFMQDWENQKKGQNLDTFKVREQRYEAFMRDYLQAHQVEDAASTCLFNSTNEIKDKSPLTDKTPPRTWHMAVINLFLARVWYDLHHSEVFNDRLRESLTKRLAKDWFSKFFKDLSVTGINLGSKLPQLLNASLPWQDENGLWVDFAVDYQGVVFINVGAKGIVFQTMDDFHSSDDDEVEEDDQIVQSPNSRSLIDLGKPNQQPQGGGGVKEILDAILRSNLVKSLVESEEFGWVKTRIIEENLNFPFCIRRVTGTLTVNFPPPPSDRLWWGFRHPPKIDLGLIPSNPVNVLPGDLAHRLEHVFVKRMGKVLQKSVVYPNLCDIRLSGCSVLKYLKHVEYNVGKKLEE